MSDFLHYVFVGLVSLVGTTFGAIFGGGSFIIQPALLAMGVLPRVAVANDVAAATFSGIFFIWHAQRNQKIDKRVALWMVPPMALGAILGGMILFRIPEQAECWIIFVACVIGLVYTLFRLKKPDKTVVDEGRVFPYWQPVSFIIGLGLGMYDGISGAGSGILIITFLAILFRKNMKSTILLANLLGVVSLMTAAMTFWRLGLLDRHLLLVMIPVSSLAGVCASQITQAVSDKNLRITFAAIVGGLVVYIAAKQIQQM